MCLGMTTQTTTSYYYKNPKQFLQLYNKSTAEASCVKQRAHSDPAFEILCLSFNELKFSGPHWSSWQLYSAEFYYVILGKDFCTRYTKGKVCEHTKLVILHHIVSLYQVSLPQQSVVSCCVSLYVCFFRGVSCWWLMQSVCTEQFFADF